MQANRQSEGREQRVPRLAPDLDPTALRLTPAEGYLLSRVDGRTPWRVLREIGGMEPAQVERCLERWLEEKVLLLDAEATGLGGGETAPAPVDPEKLLDPSLDLPVDAQRRILEFEARLGRPYHEILGVASDAPAAAVKQAYFRLSREFHPDRYFRRNVGGFAARLDRIFKKLVEAYELLSDPAVRAELERSLAGAGAGPASLDTTRPGAPPPAAAGRPRSPLAFSIHHRVMMQRKLKAKRMFEAGMGALARERWVEAAANIRLAIAFDPSNEVYKGRFAEVQLKVNEGRAASLMAEAEDALDLRELERALGLFNEALQYRPHDPELLHRAARLAWATGEDLHRAKENAQRACELAPDVAAYHRTLGQIYKAAGLEFNAKRELERALRLDPNDREAAEELRSLGRKILNPLRLGGKR